VIESLFQSGALDVMERVVRFTEQRHGVLTHNIANLSTPNFRPTDLSARDFQASLSQAVEARRNGGQPGPLVLRDHGDLRFRSGRIEARSAAGGQNILFHDRNNRNLDHEMKNLAENTMAHNMAVQMIRSEFDLLESAIRGTA